MALYAPPWRCPSPRRQFCTNAPCNGPQDEGAQRKGQDQIGYELVLALPRLHGFREWQQEHAGKNDPSKAKANNQDGKHGAMHDGHRFRDHLGQSTATGASSMTDVPQLPGNW